MAEEMYIRSLKYLFNEDRISPSYFFRIRNYYFKKGGYEEALQIIEWNAETVLEEIGKEEPITAGFVVEGGRIKQARVLVYRESRGGEIRYPVFLKQYDGAALTADHYLDRSIDGISGATLSVRAMERMARLALYFDSLVSK